MNDAGLRSPHHVVTWQWASRALHRDKKVTILVPPSADRAAASAKKYPVLVLLHGYGGNRRTWIERTRLVEYLRGTDLLVVLPESGRRWFINDHANFRYEDYLIDELVPFVQGAFAVTRERQGWAIGGFSMGGACALMQALRHPHLFSVAVSHAGAFAGPLRDGDPYEHLRSEPGFLMPTTEVHERVWGPQGSVTRCAYDPFRMLLSWRAETTLRVYADVGTGDYERIITMNQDMVTALRAAKIETEYQERDGAHDLDFVDRVLPFSLGFVLDHLKAS